MRSARPDQSLPAGEPTLRIFHIRRDLEQVLDFQREVYEVNFPGFHADDYFREDYARDLRRATRDPNEVQYVLEQEGRLCGFIWAAVISTIVDPRVGYIKNVYVAPQLRGRGQADRLMAAVEEWLMAQGVDKIMLDASVVNQRAVSFYEKLNYVTERVRMVKRCLPQSKQSSVSGGLDDG
ncbi:MAG: GNAT family N-acetyltransferase [Armatimonadetes bacterium]|nr:GNAT family N-acetyltransferase [Armatimonadota bacterium]